MKDDFDGNDREETWRNQNIIFYERFQVTLHKSQSGKNIRQMFYCGIYRALMVFICIFWMVLWIWKTFDLFLLGYTWSSLLSGMA